MGKEQGPEITRRQFLGLDKLGETLDKIHGEDIAIGALSLTTIITALVVFVVKCSRGDYTSRGSLNPNPS